jgi:hypothetical protein
MRRTPLINARSASVPRFNGRYLARMSFKITFRTASASEPAAGGTRRRTDGSARTHVYARRIDWCSCTGSLRRTTVSELPARAAARHRGERPRQTNHLRLGAVCTSAWVCHRSRNIGEAQLANELIEGSPAHRSVGSRPSTPTAWRSAQLLCARRRVKRGSRIRRRRGTLRAGQRAGAGVGLVNLAASMGTFGRTSFN